MPPERRTVSFGKALKSPIKKQGKSHKQPVSLDVQKQRWRDLEERIAQLQRPSQSTPSPSSLAFPFPLAPREDSSVLPVEAADRTTNGAELHLDMDVSTSPTRFKLSDSMHSTPPLPSVDGDDMDLLSELPGHGDSNLVPEPPTPSKPTKATPKAMPKRHRKRRKRTERADDTTEERPDLVEWWKEVLKTLEGPLLLYKERTLGAVVDQGGAPLHQCKGACSIIEETTLQGSPVKDPICRSLGQALQWYNVLQLGINRSLDDVLESIKPHLSLLPDTISTLPQPNATSSAFEKAVPKHEGQPTAMAQPEPPEPVAQRKPPEPAVQPEHLESTAQPEPPEPPTTPGRVSGYLQRLCPACFGGTRFGSSFKR
ncbi:hypothetical protein V5O48_017837, partial [Marasmius crinis-equi]